MCEQFICSLTEHAELREFRWTDWFELAEMERESAVANPWTKRDVSAYRKSEWSTILVLNHEDLGIIAYVCYTYAPTSNSLVIDRIVVHSFARQSGVGEFLVGTLQSFIEDMPRRHVVMYVPESRLDLQLFLRHCGFTAVRIIHSDTPSAGRHASEAWYTFVYTRQTTPADLPGRFCTFKAGKFDV